jgi:hypothetical protein
MTGNEAGFFSSGCGSAVITWVRAANWAAVISMMTEPVVVDPILRIVSNLS